MQFLKADTSVKVVIGPVVAVGDGFTPVTTLSLSTADEAELLKHDAGSVTDISSNTFAAITSADGYYNLTLTAAQLDTEGMLTVLVNDDSLCLPVRKDFMVVSANVFDSLFAASGTDYLDVNTFQLGGTAQTGRDVGASVLLSSGTGTGQVSLSSGTVTVGTNNDKTGYRLSSTGVDDVWDEATSGHLTAGSTGAALGGAVVLSGTIGTGGNESTTVELPSGYVADDDYYNNMLMEVISGTGVGQAEYISDFVGGTGIATLNGTLATTLSTDSVVQVRTGGNIPGATAPNVTQIADAVWDEAYGDHTSEGSFGSVLQAAHQGTLQSATSTTATLDATGASSTNDFYNYSLIEIIAGTGVGQMRQISDYNGTSKAATVSLAWTETPDNTSQYVIRAWGVDAATTAQIADAVWDESRSSHVTAGSFGEYVLADAVRVSGSATAADGLQDAVAGTTPLPSNVTQISGDATAADNLESYTDGTTPIPANATQISGDATAANNLEAMLDGTGGVTISANLDGYAEIRTSGGSAGDNTADLVSAILTTQMTESYSADGTAPTLAQALFELVAHLQESSVSGTTLTVKQQDGTTTAMTFTLDNGSTPTSITRAT